jgi:hypothetical protein
MSGRTPKRNDPCPCGSGKLYKHCCKASRRERFRGRRKLALKQGAVEASGDRDATEANQLRSVAQQLKGRVSPEEDPEFGRLLELAEEMAAYEEAHDEIEAAAEALEDHRAVLEALEMEDAEVLVHDLFAEKRFRPFRFRAEDVHRAFKAVGYPRRFSEPSQRDEEILRDAILHLADEPLRQRLSRRLLSWLPDYVSAGRYAEAWMIQISAFQMLEDRDASNPFLGEMFRHGFDAWLEEIETRQSAMLRSLADEGADIASMSPIELEEWFQEQMDDPEKSARLDEVFGAETLFRDQVRAEAMAMEQQALELLQRDDAERFLLTPDEVEAWIPGLLDRLKSVEEEARDASEEEAWDDAEVQHALQAVLLDVSQEMAVAVMTAERLDQLVADLRAYQRDLIEAEEKQLALYAPIATTVLERTEAPGEERFVIGVCMASLLLALKAMGEIELEEE